jgi:hypothetical protein
MVLALEKSMNQEYVDFGNMDLHRRIALVLRKEPGLVRVLAERLRSKLAAARCAGALSDDVWEWYIILTLWSPLQVIRLLVHQVSDWCSGAAAYFGWMREAKRENTRCGL